MVHQEKLKTLSNKEVSRIRDNIKNKKKNKKIAKKIIKNDDNNKNKFKDSKTSKIKKDKVININENKKREEVFDVCTILKKCSIDEISKYLLDKKKNANFPDITLRQ